MGIFDIFRRKRIAPGGGHQELLDRNLMWPTDSMLRSQGLSEKEVAAYRGLAQGMDAAYEKLDEIRRMDGQPPIYRKPGAIQFDNAYFKAVADYYAESLFKHRVQIPTEKELRQIPMDDPNRPALLGSMKAKREEYLESVAAIAKYHPEIRP